MRCSPLQWNPQMERIESGRRCAFAAAPNGAFAAPCVRDISCTEDEPLMAQNTLRLGPVANDDQLLLDSCRVTVCTSDSCPNALQRRKCARIETGLEVCSVVTMNERLGLSLKTNRPLSMLSCELVNTCSEQKAKFWRKETYFKHYNYILRTSVKQDLRDKQFNCQFECRKFLDNSKGLDVISLLVKYYWPLTHINKVIELLKFKSAMNLQCF